MALRGPTANRPGYNKGETSPPAPAVAPPPAPVVKKKKTATSKKTYTK